MFDIRRATTAADWRDAAALIHDHIEWMRGWAAIDPLAEQPALAAELDALGDHYGAGTRGAMFVARWSRTAVGCVAVRIHDDGTAELKRMYVRPVARGRGVADRLVQAVVDHAADQGCDSIWLETLRGAMDAAIAVYRRHGFRPAAREATLGIDRVVVMERPVAVAVGCT